MTLKEQRERNFHAIEGRAAVDNSLYSFMTFPLGVDPRIMKSRYVISIDVKASRPNEAAGIADFAFEKTIGVLTLVGTEWARKRFNRALSSVQYDYQLCGSYELTDQGEKPVEMEPISAALWMHHYPAFTDFDQVNQSLMNAMLQCHDPFFLKAQRYLMNAERGINAHLPPDKIFLDFFKCIEIIVKHLGGRKIRRKRGLQVPDFRKPLLRAARKISIDTRDVKLIQKYYSLRNEGDFAHGTRLMRSTWLMPQFPRPSETEMFNYDELRMLARRILIRFFSFAFGRYRVDINPQDPFYDFGFTRVIGMKDGDLFTDNFVFKTRERDQRKITSLAKRQVAESLSVPSRKVRVDQRNSDRIVFRVAVDSI